VSSVDVDRCQRRCSWLGGWLLLLELVLAVVLFVGLSGVFVGGLKALCWLWLENNRFWQLFLL